ncbi:MAG: hypothetical protein J6C81_05095 [Muribaculaceae bacterium]|nr:hypothetical protein [Muribaculaceae bacterium]
MKRLFSIAALLVCVASYLFPAAAQNVELTVDSCSHKNNAAYRYVHTVFWKFNMPVKAVENPGSAPYRMETTALGDKNYPMAIYIDNTEDCGYVKTFLELEDGSQFIKGPSVTNELHIPAGVLCSISDPSVTNKEIILTLRGTKEEPDSLLDPVYVKVTINANGKHIIETNEIKGKPLTLCIAQEGWKIDRLTRYDDDNTEGIDVTDSVKDGAYTIESLNNNTRFDASLTYASSLVNAEPAAEIEFPNSKVKAQSDGEKITFDGLTGNETISVLSPEGYLITTHQCAEGKDRVIIGANEGTFLIRLTSETTDEAALLLHRLNNPAE